MTLIIPLATVIRQRLLVGSRGPRDAQSLVSTAPKDSPDGRRAAITDARPRTSPATTSNGEPRRSC